MSVYPGLPRQRFIEQTLWKIRKLKELRRKNKWKFAIEVDGGIHKDNMQKITNAGADILVMGSGFFTRKQQN